MTRWSRIVSFSMPLMTMSALTKCKDCVRTMALVFANTSLERSDRRLSITSEPVAQDGKQHTRKPTPRASFLLFVHSSPSSGTFSFTCTLYFVKCTSSDQEHHHMVQLSTVSGFFGRELGAYDWIARTTILRSLQKIVHRRMTSHQIRPRYESPALVLAVPAFWHHQEPRVHHTETRSGQIGIHCTHLPAVGTAGELQRFLPASVPYAVVVPPSPPSSDSAFPRTSRQERTGFHKQRCEQSMLRYHELGCALILFSRVK